MGWGSMGESARSFAEVDDSGGGPDGNSYGRSRRCRHRPRPLSPSGEEKAAPLSMNLLRGPLCCPLLNAIVVSSQRWQDFHTPAVQV